eukprot:scaffold2537_cov304-Pinguiococcus_pyrenoidosus.AAC.5
MFPPLPSEQRERASLAVPLASSAAPECRGMAGQSVAGALLYYCGGDHRWQQHVENAWLGGIGGKFSFKFLCRVATGRKRAEQEPESCPTGVGTALCAAVRVGQGDSLVSLASLENDARMTALTPGSI